MTGDDDEEEIVQIGENVTNVVRGKVHGTLVQLESVEGDLTFPEPKDGED
ncbi:hypothetical protein [Lentzea sp. NPDC051838]